MIELYGMGSPNVVKIYIALEELGLPYTVHPVDVFTGKQFDATFLKLNPMANWSRTAVWRYIREQGIPYNPLQDQGFRSIGCWPCTSKAADGERAGRWVGFNKVECGIHTFLTKKESDYQI